MVDREQNGVFHELINEKKTFTISLIPSVYKDLKQIMEAHNCDESTAVAYAIIMVKWQKQVKATLKKLL